MKFNDSYQSKVSFYNQEIIIAEALNSKLFKFLKSIWKISSNPDGSHNVEFSIDFEFNSYIYAYIANVFFLEISKGILAAFKKRCLKINIESMND